MSSLQPLSLAATPVMPGAPGTPASLRAPIQSTDDLCRTLSSYPDISRIIVEYWESEPRVRQVVERETQKFRELMDEEFASLQLQTPKETDISSPYKFYISESHLVLRDTWMSISHLLSPPLSAWKVSTVLQSYVDIMFYIYSRWDSDDWWRLFATDENYRLFFAYLEDSLFAVLKIALTLALSANSPSIRSCLASEHFFLAFTAMDNFNRSLEGSLQPKDIYLPDVWLGIVLIYITTLDSMDGVWWLPWEATLEDCESLLAALEYRDVRMEKVWSDPLDDEDFEGGGEKGGHGWGWAT